MAEEENWAKGFVFNPLFDRKYEREKISRDKPVVRAIDAGKDKTILMSISSEEDNTSKTVIVEIKPPPASIDFAEVFDKIKKERAVPVNGFDQKQGHVYLFFPSEFILHYFADNRLRVFSFLLRPRLRELCWHKAFVLCCCGSFGHD